MCHKFFQYQTDKIIPKGVSQVVPTCCFEKVSVSIYLSKVFTSQIRGLAVPSLRCPYQGSVHHKTFPQKQKQQYIYIYIELETTRHTHAGVCSIRRYPHRTRTKESLPFFFFLVVVFFPLTTRWSRDNPGWAIGLHKMEDKSGSKRKIK